MGGLAACSCPGTCDSACTRGEHSLLHSTSGRGQERLRCSGVGNSPTVLAQSCRPRSLYTSEFVHEPEGHCLVFCMAKLVGVTFAVKGCFL